MNTQDFDKPVISSDNANQNELGANDPVLNPDPLADNVPADEALTHEAPMDGTVADVGSMDETTNHEVPIDTNSGSSMTLLNREESELLRTRWNEIQGKFVDEPHAAVQQADALVSEVVEKITQIFASELSSLKGQWNQGNDFSTEDLRKALQHYRSFFNRLVV
jgi:hypothetical protein